MIKKTINILISGVGGQGILLASELISEAAMDAGYDVKKSEIHGMAQRGGAVSSHVRIGDKIFSPLIRLGDADILLAFEIAEALRWIHFMKPQGTVIVNELRLIPPVTLINGFKYPKNPVEIIGKRVRNVKLIKADQIARKLRNPRIANMVLIGAVSKSLPIPESNWFQVIKKKVPNGTEDINLKAFQAGREK